MIYHFHKSAHADWQNGPTRFGLVEGTPLRPCLCAFVSEEMGARGCNNEQLMRVAHRVHARVRASFVSCRGSQVNTWTMRLNQVLDSMSKYELGLLEPACAHALIDEDQLPMRNRVNSRTYQYSYLSKSATLPVSQRHCAVLCECVDRVWFIERTD